MPARSRRQREILNFVTEFIEIKGYSPSYQEIANGLGLASKGAVARHIEILEASGLLTRVRNEVGFQLQPSESEVGGCRHIPIRWHDESGSDGSGKPQPVLTEELLGLFDPHRIVAFEVQDDSMSGDGIRENDVVFVELRSLATDDELVLVEINGTTLVRRYSRTGNSILLSCSNDRFEDIPTSFSKIAVIGIVRGLVRPLQ
jgi:repressor LexA